MSLEIYFKCLVACLLGNICHAAVTFIKLYREYKTANERYTFLQFLKDEKAVLAVNGVLSFALVYLADEFVAGSDFIMNKVKILFFFVGITGSWLALTIRSVGKKRIQAIIDRKTNIADGSES